MSHQFKLCESCVQRHCNKKPVKKSHHWVCVKYRKHQTGWKLKEVMHGKLAQV